MTRKTAAAIGTLALGLLLPGCAAAPAPVNKAPSMSSLPPAPTPSAAAPRPSPAIVRELAPSGRLRAAINLGNVVLAQPGGPRGVVGASVDLADELARRLGVPLDLIVYHAAGAVVDGMDADKWDIAFMAVDPKRAERIAFSAPYVYIEGTYMVRADVPYRAAADLDQPGRTIAVGKGAAYDLYLTRALRNAVLVRAATSADAIARFEQDPAIDTVAGVRQALEQEAARQPGYRVLDDAFNRIEQAVAVPQGRGDGARWVASVVEELKAGGFVRRALDASGQQDAPVAAPAR